MPLVRRSLVRAIPLLDSREQPVRENGASEAFVLGPVSASERVNGGLHVVAVSGVGAFQGAIEGSTSTAFAAAVPVVVFTPHTSAGAEMPKPVAVSTELISFRGAWVMPDTSCSGAAVVMWMGITRMT